ncbi:MAG: lysine 5,6-aminomutase subunit alpha [Planctomycetota bacterium]|jgi:beta-lysine 5,6-aminomutase alpha subunit
MNKLRLPKKRIARARRLAAAIARPVARRISRHTTTSVERATLRLLGADGVGPGDVPVPNLAANALGKRLKLGAARWWLSALADGRSVEELNAAISDGLDLSEVKPREPADLEEPAAELLGGSAGRIRAHAALRRERIEECRENEGSPLLYLIVATGNIYEDVKQAEAAAEEGADVIAVIRSTAQSLLDYVPYGPTTEGFGGTYATQENFRIMRAALDAAGERIGRYVRLVNYASGLCMPEIAAMGALERLDMMLNDSMYGVLFRDINMFRTFVDQHFSRMISAFAEIVINTGEDNYLTTSDAFEKGYTVLASQLINERLALDAGLPHRLMGLGHAFEMDPEMEDGFLYEVAGAQMAREIFPECPLKYMPPTKHMTGDIFRGYAMNTMFNFASKLTGQSIHLLGMLTEALHTPFMQDRYLSVAGARYVMKNMAGLGDEIEFRRDGKIARRAGAVLEETISFLEDVEGSGLFAAIEAGKFAEISRSPEGGKGLDGVVRKGRKYWNPAEEMLKRELGLGD